MPKEVCVTTLASSVRSRLQWLA